MKYENIVLTSELWNVQIIIFSDVVFKNEHVIFSQQYDLLFLIRSLFGHCEVYTHTFRDFRMIVKSMETTSYASSFIFYCIFNREFTSKLKRWKLCKKIRHQESRNDQEGGTKAMAQSMCGPTTRAKHNRLQNMVYSVDGKVICHQQLTSKHKHFLSTA